MSMCTTYHLPQISTSVGIWKIPPKHQGLEKLISIYLLCFLFKNPQRRNTKQKPSRETFADKHVRSV